MVLRKKAMDLQQLAAQATKPECLLIGDVEHFWNLLSKPDPNGRAVPLPRNAGEPGDGNRLDYAFVREQMKTRLDWEKYREEEWLPALQHKDVWTCASFQP